MSKRAEEAMEAAKLAAQQARNDLQAQMLETRDRFKPQRLKEDAINAANQYVDDATDVTVATIKEHPVAFGATFLGTLAFWYRKPLVEKSPDAIECVGGGLAKLRDWIAPSDWTPTSKDRNKDK